MKALTIHQPYARLIVTGEKLIENRTWPTRYRGRLLIHAGRSVQSLSDGEAERYALDSDPLEFGALVGFATVADCQRVEELHARCQDGRHDDLCPGSPRHDHCFGPWCWVLEDVQRFEAPVPYRGAQGLFDVPDVASLIARSTELQRKVADRVAHGQSTGGSIAEP